MHQCLYHKPLDERVPGQRIHDSKFNNYLQIFHRIMEFVEVSHCSISTGSKNILLRIFQNFLDSVFISKHFSEAKEAAGLF